MSCKRNQLLPSLRLKGSLDEQDDYCDNPDGEIKEKELMKEGGGLTGARSQMMKAFGTLTDKKSFKRFRLTAKACSLSLWS